MKTPDFKAMHSTRTSWASLCLKLRGSVRIWLSRSPTASLRPPNREYQPCSGPGEKQGAKNLAVDASTLTVRRLAFCRSLHLHCSGGGLFAFVLGRTTPPSWPELFHTQHAATTALGEKNRCQHILFLYLVKKNQSIYIYTNPSPLLPLPVPFVLRGDAVSNFALCGTSA